ncbi:MAG: PEP-utilizing enzyme [Acidimicrobiales bacterium]
MADTRFPSPFDIEAPEGVEGWEELYTYALIFSDGRRDYEESRFWFFDSMHWGWAVTPWDATHIEHAISSLAQYNSRHYLVPPADGIDFRILYGYPFFSPVTIEDPARIESRVPQFMERGGYYFQNWDRLYENWLGKIKATIADIADLKFEPLPEVEDMAVITDGRGSGSGYELQAEYHRFKDLVLMIWQLHFEFLNLGYAAYLDYFGFCKRAFPGIPDLAIARMVAGIDVDLFRPNEELKKLAHKAVELGIEGVFDAEDRDTVQDALASTAEGKEWQAAWDEVKEPWFNFSSGTGFYHYDKAWIDYPEIPYGFIRDYIAKIRAGETIARPIKEITAERERIVSEYGELLATDEDRATFESKLGLARVVFPYVENHNFYIEHWAMSVFWRKLRELAQVFVKEGFIEQEDDLFLMRRDEVDEALYDMYMAWAVNAPAAGPHYWPPKLARRRAIYDKLRQWQPPKGLGEPPAVVTEPFTIMLWGITSDSVQTWLGAEEGAGELTGMAASPGVAEGPARLVYSADDISDVQEGEILVAPITAPSWAPVFPKIRACVTDIGGVMSHAAIVCREYGVPAVTGTAYGTREIKTGQRVKVDGNAGTVTILDGQD